MKILERIRGDERLRLLLLAIPFVVFIFMFSYVPLFGWIYSFFNYKPGIPLSRTPFVGLENYALIFTFYKKQIWGVLRNTLIFSSLGLLCSPLPMLFAIFLNEIKSLRFKKLVQTTTTLPHFISWIIVFSLAFSIFSDSGVVNNILISLGLIENPTMLLGNSDVVYIFQMMLGWWKSTGWGAIIYIAAISGIDMELYDAAAVDGAGRFARMRHITVPGLLPTYLVLLLLSIGSIISVGFDQYFVFYNALVADKIEVIDTFVFRVGISKNDYSFATAVGIMKTFISLMLLFSANNIAKKVRGEAII
ncbi:MAG: ABC transporter permease subunit [Oscillospiraceae bacterium]|nr:ABC transporter permease subunit [Oscillospiraceae bacterium]